MPTQSVGFRYLQPWLALDQALRFREEEEREHIRKAVISLEKTTGQRPLAGIADTVQEPIPAVYLNTVGFFTTAITTVTSCRFGRQSTDTLT